MQSSKYNGPPHHRPPAKPEPGGDSQVDIASRVQGGLKKSNEQREPEKRTSPTGHKATEFDGSPNPRADEGAGVFKPADETPAVMPKRSGPKNPE